MSKSQKHYIIKDRVEVYKDFSLNLLRYIYKYYLDKESLNDDNDIRNHYTWCFNKVCDEFKEEDINFSDNDELKEYFFLYYYHEFYKKKNNSEISIEYFENFWRDIFEIDNQKNKNIINILIEVYTIYDKSINSKRNVLEIV